MPTCVCVSEWREGHSPLDAMPIGLTSSRFFWALASLAADTIFIDLVIFSILFTDFRRVLTALHTTRSSAQTREPP